MFRTLISNRLIAIFFIGFVLANIAVFIGAEGSDTSSQSKRQMAPRAASAAEADDTSDDEEFYDEDEGFSDDEEFDDGNFDDGPSDDGFSSDDDLNGEFADQYLPDDAEPIRQRGLVPDNYSGNPYDVQTFDQYGPPQTIARGSGPR